MDREKVIKALEDFNKNRICLPHLIPWDEISDAIALLKEQEPVRVGKKIKAGDVFLDFYQCGHCKNAIRQPWRYCPFCGQAVKWE